MAVRAAVNPGVHAGYEIYPDRLNEPMLVFVLNGPVSADGYEWYLVEPFDLHVCVDVCGERPPFGWVAQAGKGGEPWIAPGTIDCPRPDAEDLGWLSSTASLACFGGEVLTLQGSMGGCYASETPVAWQQTVCVLHPPDYVPRDTFESLLRMYPAEGVRFPTEREGVNIRVTGHFDDPAAESCAVLASLAPDFGLRPIPAELAVLWCRGAFVVTDVDVL